MLKQRLKMQLKVSVSLLIVLVSLLVAMTSLAATKTDELEVAPGVNYSKYDESSTNSVRVMEVDLTKPHLTVGLGMDPDFQSLLTTSSIARKFSLKNYRMVGGINGSIFHFATKKPAYLLSQNGNILNLGAVSNDSDGYMSIPTAFGMKRNGQALIDRFQILMSAEINGKTFKIDKFNSSRGAGESVLYTPSFRWDWPRNNKYGVEIYVHKTDKKIDSSEMKFGDTIVGEVLEIRPYMSGKYITIPQDGFVISVHGNSPIAQGLKVGDSIKLTVDVEDKWKNTNFIMGSGPKLVDSGQVDLEINENSTRAKEVTHRTAIGINKDGSKVFFITVDGGKNSRGMTLPQFAKYVQSLGVYKAINLDGGGSTTMVARQYGNEYPTVVNNPTGGSERGVVNGLYAIVTAESDIPSKISVQAEEKGKVLVGAKVNFKLNYVLNEYYHPMKVTNDQIQYRVEGNVGRMEGSTFIAEKAGKGTVIASYGQAKTSIPIEVVAQVDAVKIEPNNLKIGLGKKQKFVATPYMKDGSKIIWQPDNIKWSVTNGIGEIDSKGLFTAGSESRSGQVHASINGKPYKTDVVVGGDYSVFETFESNKNWGATSILANSSVRQSRLFEPVAFGKHSLRLEYDFRNQESGTSAAYASYNGDVKITERPKAIGMFVYGDQNEHWLRARLTDGNGKIHYISFTGENELNWDGWKYVSAQIPNEVKLPFRIDQIYVAETSEAKKDRGVIFIDQVLLTYNDEQFDLSHLAKLNLVDPKKSWEITFDKPIDRQSINKDSIYIEDALGNKHDVSYEFLNNDQVIIVQPKNHYKSGEFYRLVINEKIQSVDGFNKFAKTTKSFKSK
ncbi:phosphodiester glycosidase family protein [Bacillaceae bacterium W0354]